MTSDTDRTYQVVATVVRPGQGRQVPTFFLDAQVQGIVSADHARSIVDGILNPFGDVDTVIYATVRCVQTGEYSDMAPTTSEVK